jgi:hypothetical protein
VFEQTPQDAPKLVGFKLGMTSAEAGLSGPHSTWLGKPTFGAAVANLWREELNKISPGRGVGVEQINPTFFDDRLARIRVIYDDSKRWPSFSDFQKEVTSRFDLPPAWNPMDPFEDAEENLMKCADLEISIRYFARSRATVKFEDIRAWKQYRERSGPADKQKRKA